LASALEVAEQIVTIEINGSSDNPTVLGDTDEVISCGAYFTAQLSAAIEALNRAFVYVGHAQLSRMAKLLNPEFSGLPLFLARADSQSNGFAPMMKPAEAWMMILAQAAQPAPIWPSLNANGVEDCLAPTQVAIASLRRICGRRFI